MSKKKRQKPLYQRGPFWLGWDLGPKGERRSPNLAIFWHDPERGGNRSKSARTASIEDGKTALDAFFLEQTKGESHCPTCGQPRRSSRGYLMSAAIADYLIGHARRLDSYEAIRARLDHILDYADSLPSRAVACDAIDEPWIQRFRDWAAKRPIISPKAGIERERSASTIEGSVAQLAAAINWSYRRGDASGPPRFKSIPLRGLNQTPQHRSSLEEIAAMFRYCVAPDISAELERAHWGRQAEPISPDILLEIRRREREKLHRFLMLSVATLARPDAAHDFSLTPERGQWIPAAQIINLNPKGRRQTRKFRATIPAARQIVPIISAAPKDYFIGAKSIRKAWEGMAAAIGLPGEREAGQKLIRRSMSNLCRAAMPEEAWGELSMFMGHDSTDPITDLYAPFSPRYLRRALGAIESIIDEIQALAPGAFASAGGKIVSIGRKA